MKNRIISLLLAISVVLSFYTINGNAFSTASSGIKTEKLYLLEKPASDYGYVDYAWIDDDGNIVNTNQQTAVYQSKTRTAAVLPTAYDARDDGYVTAPKNQGMTGSCWAFASAACAESNLLYKGLRNQADEQLTNNLSESHLVWFTHESLTDNAQDGTYGDGTAYDNPYTLGGNWLLSTSTLARGSGFVLEEDFPFYPYNVSGMGNYDESDRYQQQVILNNAFMLPNDRNTIKNAVLNYGSVMTAFCSLSDYYCYTDEHCSYYQNIYQSTNHQVLVVGWDDDYAVSNFKEGCQPVNTGAWLIKNSGGTAFGEDGYFWISYEDPSLAQFIVQDVDDAGETDDIYQYDGFGYGIQLSGTENGVRCQTGSIANVFTAKQDENLNKIGFYVTQENVSYTIEIYTGVTKMQNTPIYNGTKVSETSGYVSYKGYYTAVLPKKIALTGGDNFTVVVKYESQDGVYLPLEGATKYMAPQDGTEPVPYMYFHSNPGESYYNLNDSEWVEANSDGVNNACIKAFTENAGTISIKTPEELKAFRDSVNEGNTYQDKTVLLENNLDLSSQENFEPIGNAENPFLGNFKGNGHVIKGIEIQKTSSYTGLFGYLGAGASVSNLGLESGSITGNDYVGSFAGYCDQASIVNCYSMLQVDGIRFVGGIAGYADTSQFSSVHFSGELTADSESGAFAGYNSVSVFSRCYYLASSYMAACSNVVSGVKAATSEEMKNGGIAYALDGGERLSTRTYQWKKGDRCPLFANNNADAVFKIELFDTETTDSDYVFASANDNLQVLASAQRKGYLCHLYSNYSCTVAFDAPVASDLILYAVWENISLKADAAIVVFNENYIAGLTEYQNTVGIVKTQFENNDIEFYDPNGQLLGDSNYIATGTTAVLKDSEGNIVDKKIFVLYGDTNGDAFVDVFDLTLIRSYISYEIEDSEISGQQMLAMDVNHDEVIDELDGFFINLVTIFAAQIDQNPLD